jgi:hypothetical protein
MLPASTHLSTTVASHTFTKNSFIRQLLRYCKLITAVYIICNVQKAAAQKVFPVSKSALTGIVMPGGTKQDKRLLITASANAVMQDVGKKSNVFLKTAEVLYLPINYTADSLTSAAQQSGWTVTADDTNKNFYWLQQGGKYVLANFFSAKKENSIYFAESNQAPSGTGSITAANNSAQNNSTVTQQNNTIQDPVQQKPALQSNPVTASVNSSFAFSTTNFDDGWNATEQSDWVEVTKSNIKVLLHYPKDGTVFPADPEPLTNAAWNILVAPRYSNLKNYKTAYINTYNRPYLGMGYATENATGKDVFILLFRQGGGWLEFVTPDKNTFIQQYKFDPEAIRWDSESDLLKLLTSMSNYNKFAIAATDFKGKWTSDFSGIQQLYNVYTGAYAGMHINQSNEDFIFGDNGTYNWKLLVVNGMAGNAKFNQVKSSGTLSVINNWQVKFSMIENKAKTCHAFWSCIKGARILNLLDANYPGSGIYTQYGLSK